MEKERGGLSLSPLADFTPTQRPRWMFHPFTGVFCCRAFSTVPVPLWSQVHSVGVINHRCRRRAWPIVQLRSAAAPEHARQKRHKAHKRPSNQAAGKTRPKQAPTARLTPVFHHPHALTLPPAHFSAHTYTAAEEERGKDGGGEG